MFLLPFYFPDRFDLMELSEDCIFPAWLQWIYYGQHPSLMCLFVLSYDFIVRPRFGRRLLPVSRRNGDIGFDHKRLETPGR